MPTTSDSNNPFSPLLSIITVTYNAAGNLNTTLSSIKNQVEVTVGSDFEYLIIDGASTDSTADIVADSDIHGLRFVSEPDNGIYDAMNKAIDIAFGKYLMFLNAGDSLHSPTTLREILDAILTNDYPGIVYGQTNIVDSQRRFLCPRHLSAPRELTYKSFADGMLVCHQAFIALARVAPYYDLSYRYSADYDWCLQCLQHSRRNVYIDSVLVDYLNEGITTRNRLASLKERYSIMCNYFGYIPTTLRHFSFALRFVRQKLRKVLSNHAKSIDNQ